MTPTELREARQKAGMGQQALADVPGLGRYGWQRVSRFENGREPIPEAMAAKVRELAEGPCPLCGCERRKGDD